MTKSERAEVHKILTTPKLITPRRVDLLLRHFASISVAELQEQAKNTKCSAWVVTLCRDLLGQSTMATLELAEKVGIFKDCEK